MSADPEHCAAQRGRRWAVPRRFALELQRGPDHRCPYCLSSTLSYRLVAERFR
ncbi:hypothetical protein IG631_17676 [Alternaria alternata]|nr:hypothetical protein IG631_17676 [Alternaria alternata]